MIFAAPGLVAQTTDTTHIALGEVVISSVKAEKFTAGRKVQHTDSLVLNRFNTISLADLLGITTPVFVKNYGPGALATTSFRGGSAYQTALLWNGLNIQNPMLGMNDLSQLPNFAFDDVAVDYGGSSALWGSGAVGGSINLGNKPYFDRGLRTSMSTGIGSFGTRKLNCGLHYSTPKFSTNTKVYLNRSDNNFTYSDTSIKRNTHNNYEQKGFMEEISALLGRHRITARGWYHEAFRNLAPTIGGISRASQTDENTRLMLDWTWQRSRFVPAVKLAYFRDRLDYTDSISDLFSKSTTSTFIAEAEAWYQLNPHHKLYLGGNFTSYNANTNQFTPPTRRLDKTAFLAGYAGNFLNGKLNINLAVRQEISNAIVIPLTGNAGISFSPSRIVKLKMNGAKVYRQPTFNDLYWPVTGNPNLKPEEGYTCEGGIEAKLPLGKFTLQTELTGFARYMQNWISWIPAPNGGSQPVNLLKVYSRGTETSSSILYAYKKLVMKLGFNSAYTLSTSMRSALANDESVNRQLIYTPRYNFGAQFTFVCENFTLLYFHNYIGYRFSSSDNSSWLEPYHVANLKAAYTMNVQRVGLTFGFQVNNIFNASYYVVAQRPMPLRNYEANITLTYRKPNKEKKQ